MNHENINRINNYIYRYSIKDTAENFNKIAEVITKREFYIYRKILYIIDNCCVVEEDSTQITVEICLDEHRHLLEDLTNKFFTKKLGTRKTETKIGHAYVVGELFLTIKFGMVFDLNNRDRYPFDKPRKLKHLTLTNILSTLKYFLYIYI